MYKVSPFVVYFQNEAQVLPNKTSEDVSLLCFNLLLDVGHTKEKLSAIVRVLQHSFFENFTKTTAVSFPQCLGLMQTLKVLAHK